MKTRKKLTLPPLRTPRLGGWLLVIGLVSPQQLPVVLYKLALITLAAVVGYWLDRSLFPKARPGQYLHHDHPEVAQGRHPVRGGCHQVFAAAQLRRAVIVSECGNGVVTMNRYQRPQGDPRWLLFLLLIVLLGGALDADAARPPQAALEHFSSIPVYIPLRQKNCSNLYGKLTQ